MSSDHNLPESNPSFASTIFKHWQLRDADLEEGKRLREADRIKTRNLYAFSSAVGAISLAGLALFTTQHMASEVLTDLEVLACLDAHQTAAEEASQTGQVQLVTVAGCEATVSPPQTTTIP